MRDNLGALAVDAHLGRAVVSALRQTESDLAARAQILVRPALVSTALSGPSNEDGELILWGAACCAACGVRLRRSLLRNVRVVGGGGRAGGRQGAHRDRAVPPL